MAEIFLSYSKEDLVAVVPEGEELGSALQKARFLPYEPGVYRRPAETADQVLAARKALDLVAAQFDTPIHSIGRPFIGDAARAIADLLPGRWGVDEVLTHPRWQTDLARRLWNTSELRSVVRSDKVPYAVTLRNAESDITLLLVDRPATHSYLVGALAPEHVDEDYRTPHAPPSKYLRGTPDGAAEDLTHWYLLSYAEALAAYRTEVVVDTLRRVRQEYEAWQSIVDSGRFTDATPIGFAALGALNEEFLDLSWRCLRTVAAHAPALIESCRPAASPWPRDAQALARATQALVDFRALREEQAASGQQISHTERNAQAWPVMEALIAEAPALRRQILVTSARSRPVAAGVLPPAAASSPRPARRL